MRSKNLLSILFFKKPYKESKKNLKIVFLDKFNPNRDEPLTLRKKAICLLKGLAYLVPIINSIIYIAEQILKTKRKQEEWNLYFEKHPLKHLAENNLNELVKDLPLAIKKACNRYTDPKTKSVECPVIHLYFDSQATLKEMVCGPYYMGMEDEVNPHYFGSMIRMKLTNKEKNNHNPFFFDRDLVPNRFRQPVPEGVVEIMQLMIDMLNHKHSKLAVIDFKNFEYDENDFDDDDY